EPGIERLALGERLLVDGKRVLARVAVLLEGGRDLVLRNLNRPVADDGAELERRFGRLSSIRGGGIGSALPGRGAGGVVRLLGEDWDGAEDGENGKAGGAHRVLHQGRTY